MNLVVPATDWPETAGFFSAAAQGQLAVRACRTCGRLLHLPRSICSECGSADLEWRQVSGRAHLYSWTTIYLRHPSFASPFTMVLVELDDAPGVRLVGRLPGEPPLEVGMPMQAWFEMLEGGAMLPQFAPVGRD